MLTMLIRNNQPMLLISRGRETKIAAAWRTDGKQKGGEKHQVHAEGILCLFGKSWKEVKNKYTYWKISQTFHTKAALNPSLCTTGDGGQTLKKQPEHHLRKVSTRDNKNTVVSVPGPPKPRPLHPDSAHAPNAASQSPLVHCIGSKITASTPYVVYYVLCKAPFEIQLLTKKL